MNICRQSKSGERDAKLRQDVLAGPRSSVLGVQGAVGARRSLHRAEPPGAAAGGLQEVVVRPCRGGGGSAEWVFRHVTSRM